MLPTRQGSFRLFHFAGIDVFLHWSWFLVAILGVQTRVGVYQHYAWNVLEYLALFAIVTMHEFGHALACRSVGGRADQIVLWPLGGVAYVAPPRRPGATLWSIAAGPLVNVGLLPVLYILARASYMGASDLQQFFVAVWWTNFALLIFNLLPVYPLDGGQILRSFLWFVVGEARSLLVAAIIGFAGVAALGALALAQRSVWLGILAGFAGLQCWRGYQQSRVLSQIAALPRRDNYRCPACGKAPPIGAYWGCGKCRTAFDTFATNATCPACATRYDVTRCVECGASSAPIDWLRPVNPSPTGN